MDPHNKISYSLDTSLSSAFREVHEANWNFNVYSTEIDIILDLSVDDVFNYFESMIEKYRVWYGNTAYFYGEDISVLVSGKYGKTYLTATSEMAGKKRFDDEILISGRKDAVLKLRMDFLEHFKGNIIEDHFSVDWVSMGPNGLSYTSMPVKNRQKFYPEMYPVIDNVENYIDDFVSSPSNVLILTGPAGLGKSAFINHMILRSKLKTQVVYDMNVMQTDELYSSFISNTMRNGGGMMVLEDSDLILESREFSKNETMSRLLNISEGIIDTSRTKFVFTANINSVNDIDSALTRPGRCYDVLEFRNLNRNEAQIAADAIGKKLVGDKEDFTVAEIFNEKANNNNIKLRRVGF